MRQISWGNITFLLCSLFCVFVALLLCLCFLRLIVLRLERKEGVRRQHVGVVDETTVWHDSDPEFSLIVLLGLRLHALRLCLVCVVDVRVRLRSSVENWWSAGSGGRSVHGAFSHKVTWQTKPRKRETGRAQNEDTNTGTTQHEGQRRGRPGGSTRQGEKGHTRTRRGTHVL